jgi:hypothetical protein
MPNKGYKYVIGILISDYNHMILDKVLDMKKYHKKNISTYLLGSSLFVKAKKNCEVEELQIINGYGIIPDVNEYFQNCSGEVFRRDTSKVRPSPGSLHREFHLYEDSHNQFDFEYQDGKWISTKPENGYFDLNRNGQRG